MPNLLTSLVEHWKLNEVSGNATGAHAGLVLTDVNTVTSATGKVYALARDFELSNTESMSLADRSEISTGDIDFAFAVWVNAEQYFSFPFVFSKDNAGVSQREYGLYYDTGVNRFKFQVSANGTSVTEVTASTFGAASTGVWYFLACWHDSVANTLNICVNNGAVDSASYSSGGRDGTSPLVVGARTGALLWDGLIEGLSMWKRVLTADDLTYLYNGGNGRTYETFAGSSASSQNHRNLLYGGH